MVDFAADRNFSVWKADTFRLPIRLRFRLTPTLPYSWVDLTGSVLVFSATWPGQVGGPFERRSDVAGWWIGNQASGAEKGAATLILSQAETAAELPAAGVAVKYTIRQIDAAGEVFTRLFGILTMKAW